MKITRKPARSPETRNISFLGIAIRGFELNMINNDNTYDNGKKHNLDSLRSIDLFFTTTKKKTVLQARSPLGPGKIQSTAPLPLRGKNVNFPAPPTNGARKATSNLGPKTELMRLSRRKAKAPSKTHQDPTSKPTYYNLPQTKPPATPRTTQGTAAG